MWMQMGRILGIVGAILALVGTFLPWATISSDFESITASGIAIFFIGIPVLLFAIIGLILVAMPKRGTAIGGFVMGILCLIFMMLAFVVVSILEGLVTGTNIEISYDYGLWVSLVGSILLMIGGIWAFVELGKAPPAPAPMMPMEPPMEQPPME
jgi:hypothetical protein